MMNRLSNREGFTLVEVMIAMVILTTVMATLAGLTFQTARRALSAQGTDQRQAVMMEQVNMMSAVPFDSLRNFVGCSTVTAEPFPHTRCITRESISATVFRMKVIMTPTRSNVWAPDTMQIDRSKAPPNPLNS